MRPNRMDIHETILDTIGETPLIRLQKIFRKPGVEILMKHEGFNPCGSVKERIALALIRGAEKEGELQAGMTLVESSSGNTGIGLAIIFPPFKRVPIMAHWQPIWSRKYVIWVFRLPARALGDLVFLQLRATMNKLGR